MKKSVALSAVITTAVMAALPAFAATTCEVSKVQTTTINSEPVVQENVIMAPDTASNITVLSATTSKNCDLTLVPTVQPTVFLMNQPLGFVSGMVIEVVRPDDLNTRRAELNARILVEQAAGTITTAQGNELIDRLAHVTVDESNMKANGTLTWKAVEHTYRDFDKISHDLDNYSTDTDHRLAANIIVL